MHALLEVDKVVKQRKFFEREESNMKSKNLEHPLKALRSIIHVKEDINADSNTVFWDELFIPKQGVLLNLNINKGDSEDSFHRAIGAVQILGQCFGIMPVVGVLGENASCLRFEWKTWRMGYCLSFMAGAFFLSVLSFVFMVYVGFSVDNAGMLVFYGSCFTVQVLFLRLSLQWADLGQEISRVEAISAQTPRPGNLTRGFFSLRTRFNCCAFIVLFMALVEHGLCILSGVANAYSCDKVNTVVKGHYITAFPQVFLWTEYAHWKAFILQIMNLSATFVWNFMDLFIILLSLGLSNSFENLNKILDSVMGNNFSENFWRSARNEYAHLSQLVRKVDEAINQIVLLSFTQNLYIICRQLFHTLRSGNDDPSSCVKSKDGLISGLAGPIYFVFSFSFLVFRFLAVALYASRLHGASRLPLAALYYVTPKFYSIEVQRFLDQVTTETVALTGLNCFYITRNLILTIAGTVVTYELVMVQFNMPKTPFIKCNDTFVNSSF